MSKEYFAVACELSDLIDKVDNYYTTLHDIGHTQKMQTSFYFFYGKGNKAAFLQMTGSQRQNKELMVNDYGSLVEHVLTLVTSERPSFDVRCTNSDYKSMAQAILGEQILEYYMRENEVKNLLKTQCDYALKYSEGFLGLDWDATSGRFVGQSPEMRPIMSGDIKYTVYTPLQVVRDIRNQNSTDWVILVETVNKYELAAKYPNQEDFILSASDKSVDPSKRNIDFLVRKEQQYDTDVIFLYTFYHKKCLSLPEGRMCKFIDSVKLTDGTLPYDTIPITRMSPKNFDSTCLGYTPMWNLLGIQDASDRLYSALVSNNLAFAKQVLQTTSASDITPSDLAEGMLLIESEAEIKPLQLTKSAPESYQLIEMLKVKGQEFSGVNEVVRGTPGPNLRSGNALVVVAAQALVFHSGTEDSYNTGVEAAGTMTLRFLKQFAEHPRFATIVGKYKKAYLKEFTADDLSNIDRVTVERRNPVMGTTAGKVQMAENLLTNGIITSADQYLMVLETGNLDPMSEPAVVSMLLIKEENEKLAEGIPVVAVLTDKHQIHIEHHTTVLANTEARRQPAVVAAVLDHIQEHIDITRTADPETLKLMGSAPSEANSGIKSNTSNSPLEQPSVPGELPAAATRMPKVPEGADALTAEAAQNMTEMTKQGV